MERWRLGRVKRLCVCVVSERSLMVMADEVYFEYRIVSMISVSIIIYRKVLS